MTESPPSIVLVGGAPGAGKTTLARALAVRLGVPSYTFDHVVTGIRAVTAPATHPAFHTGRAGHLSYFTDRRPDQLIADALELEAATWPAVERICALSRPHGLVMDWWLLSPRRLESTELAALWIEIDPGALEARERAQESFFADSDDPDRMFENFMARSIWANEHYPSRARELGFPVIHQPGDRPTSDLVDETIASLAAGTRRQAT